MVKTRALKTALERRRQLIRQKNAQAENRLNAALGIPDVKQAHDRYIHAAFDNALKNKDDDKTVQKAYSAYQKALLKHGFSEDDFEFKPLCALCGDAGEVDGKMCRCLFDEYVECLKEVCNIKELAPYTFETSDLSIVKDQSQREQLEKVYAAMRGFAKRLPDVKKRLVTLSGGVGTGKTYLADAIANEVVSRGKSVKILSAFEFNSLMITAHTSPIAARAGIMKDVLTADLLVLDDLGVESMTRNVTVEYLLLTLEERERKNLCTVITTNLDLNRIMDRYGERIYSRLTNKATSLVIELTGGDLRRGA